MSKGTIKDGRWVARISMGKDENRKRVFRSFYGKSREEAGSGCFLTHIFTEVTDTADLDR